MNLKTATRPFKLLIEPQEKKGKEVCDEIVYQNLSKTDALKNIKPHNCTGEAKNAIISNTITQKEELDYADARDIEYEFPNIAIRQRNNFCFSSLVGSTVYLLTLGLVSNPFSIVFEL